MIVLTGKPVPSLYPIVQYNNPQTWGKVMELFEMYLSCYTQDEIAEVVGMAETQIREIVSAEMDNCPKARKLSAEYNDEFSPPLYTIWNFANQSAIQATVSESGLIRFQ